jgi:hypothetical protein
MLTLVIQYISLFFLTTQTVNFPEMSVYVPNYTILHFKVHLPEFNYFENLKSYTLKFYVSSFYIRKNRRGDISWILLDPNQIQSRF